MFSVSLIIHTQITSSVYYQLFCAAKIGYKLYIIYIYIYSYNIQNTVKMYPNSKKDITMQLYRTLWLANLTADRSLWFWVAMFCFIFLVSIPDAVGKKFTRSNSMAFVTSQLETLGMIEQSVWLWYGDWNEQINIIT